MSRRNHAVVIAGILVFGAFLGGQVKATEETRFSPAEHFPSPSVLFLSVSSLEGLAAAVRETLPGRIVSHPRVRDAIRGGWNLLEETLRREAHEFVEVTGKTPIEVIDLFTGEIALTVRGMGANSVPEIAVVVELGRRGDELVDLYTRLKHQFEAESGKPLHTQAFHDWEMTVWPTPKGAFFAGSVGSHLLFSSSESLVQAIADNYHGQGQTSLKESAPYQSLQTGLGVDEPHIFVGLDATWWRSLGMALAGKDSEELRAVFTVTGLDRVTTLGAALRVKGGSIDSAFHLGMRGGPGGALAAIRDHCAPISDLGDALSRTPASATRVQGSRTRLGALLQKLDSLVRESIAKHELDEVYDEIAKLGISVSDDLFTLPEITTFAFSAPPPAGSLFRDEVVLVKTDQFQPYWDVLNKFARRFGGGVRENDWQGHQLESMTMFNSEMQQQLSLPRLLSSAQPAAMGPLVLGGVVFGGLTPGGSFTRVDLSDGWTAMSLLPQALMRYVSNYQTAPKLSADDAFAGYAKQHFENTALASAWRGNQSLLWGYNSLVAVANMFSPWLGQVGIDTTKLPPGETFRADPQPGHARLALEENGFTFRVMGTIESADSLLVPLVASGVIVGALLD